MIETMNIEAPSGAGSQYLQSSKRGDFPTRIKRILVPTDLTKESEGEKAGVALA
jgi:hypothetical protein